MRKIDYLNLDGQSLHLFLAVLEAGSVTAAANRLNLTQSAVSHTLQKLREILGDPLFVKSGRGIIATAHAHSLAPKARQLIESLETLAQRQTFDPSQSRLSFTIAANDFQAELVLPEVFRRLGSTAARVELRIIPSGLPTAELLRERQCDLILSPVPPEGTDIIRRRIFDDRYACFFDSSQRKAPEDLSTFLAARHITVVHSPNNRLEFDKRVEMAGIVRDIIIRAQGFSAVPSFLKGTAMVATLPGMLRHSLMRPFAWAPVPSLPGSGDDLAFLPMYMVWHRRNQLDPAHAWLRDIVVEVARETRSATGEETLPGNDCNPPQRTV